MTAGLSSSDFFIPGSLINVEITPDPVTRGLPEIAVAMFARSQVLDATPSENLEVKKEFPLQCLEP